MRVISLTSIPPRFPDLGPTLESLVLQDVDMVRLNIPDRYARWPDWDGALPEVPGGVTVCRVGADLGPATKVLPTARDLRGKDAQILFCDDDCNVPLGWAKRLFDIQARRSNEAVAVYVRPSYLPRKKPHYETYAWQVPIRYDLPYRVSRVAHKLVRTPVAYRRPFWRSGYGDVLFGVGGAVVRPEFFDDVAFDIPDIARPVDDIWLSAMLARKNIAIYCPRLTALPKAHRAAGVDALMDTEFLGKGRQALNVAASEYCRDRFGIWC